MYTFKIYDLTGTLQWQLLYTPEIEPQFVTEIGDSHTWLWDMFSGSLLKDGRPDLIEGGWAISIERAET